MAVILRWYGKKIASERVEILEGLIYGTVANLAVINNKNEADALNLIRDSLNVTSALVNGSKLPHTKTPQTKKELIRLMYEAENFSMLASRFWMDFEFAYSDEVRKSYWDDVREIGFSHIMTIGRIFSDYYIDKVEVDSGWIKEGVNLAFEKYDMNKLRKISLL